MRVQMKGVHAVRRRLVSGETRVYHYAWRGGPRLRGEPGSAEFVADYRKAMDDSGRGGSRRGAVGGLIDAYLASPDFMQKSDSTRRDYQRQLAKVDAKFGRVELRDVQDRRFRPIALRWRDSMADKPRTADAAFGMLQAVLSFGVRRNILERNVCAGGGRLYKADRAEIIWMEEDLSAVLKVAPPAVADVLIFALWTGQRQGDTLGWRWDGFTGTHLRKRTNKRGAYVSIPAGGPLLEMLTRRKAAHDAGGEGDRRSTILTNSRGQPWTPDGFRSSWARVATAAEIKGKTFNDLRGTAVTRLALAGCNEAQIASITGHSLATVSQLLDAHYLGGRAELAEQAMAKLAERYGQLTALSPSIG